MQAVQDVRYAIRQLRRAPGFAITAVLTLALGLGSSSAIFCLIDGLWLHPLQVPHTSELVRLFTTTEQQTEGEFSYPEYQALAQQATTLKSVVAIGRRGSIMPRADGTSALLLTNVVSANFFEALGVHPQVGRLYGASDAQRLRTNPGVVLGYTFWKHEFGGDPTVVGRQITVLRGKGHRTQLEIWGVLPPEFREVDADSDRDLWMPAETWNVVAGPSDLTSRSFRWFNLIGRLAPAASVKGVNEQVSAITMRMQSDLPTMYRVRGAFAMSDFRYRISNAKTAGIVLFAIVGGVVLLAIVNVAHLLMARALARNPEVALRLSLGAQRHVVARQLLIESVMLGILSLASGVGLAAAIAAALPKLLVRGPEMLNASGEVGTRFNIDWRVFGFASALALVTILLLSLVPLLQAARAELLPTMQSNTRTEGRASLFRRATVWVQIAIAFTLLVSTTTLIWSFVNTRTKPIGLTRNQVLMAWTQEPEAPMRDEVVRKMRAIPGVTNVGYAIRSPLSLSEGGIALKTLIPSHPEIRDAVTIKFNAVSPSFLNVTGTHIVRGRGFTDEDERGGAMNVVVNQALAQKYWHGREPIGQILRFAGQNVEARVVGIAQNAPINAIGELPEPYIYVPYQQYSDHLDPMGEITFALATQQNAMSLAQPVRRVLVHTHPLLDPMMVTSLPELIRYSAGTYQMMAELVTALGIIGLALTIVGLYGFLAFRVAQRRREIGIRMALGASREATARLVLRDTLRLAGVGLAIGAVLAVAAGRLEASVLFGVQPLNALSLIAALVTLFSAAMAASWIPAKRAASIEPMQALRTE